MYTFLTHPVFLSLYLWHIFKVGNVFSYLESSVIYCHYRASVKYLRLARQWKTKERQYAAELKSFTLARKRLSSFYSYRFISEGKVCQFCETCTLEFCFCCVYSIFLTLMCTLLCRGSYSHSRKGAFCVKSKMRARRTCKSFNP